MSAVTEADLRALEAVARKARDAAQAADEKLKDALNAQNEARREPLKALVVRAHACLCRWNHTDGCGWGYEEGSIDAWKCDAHARWLAHYDRIINGDRYTKPRATLEEVQEVIGLAEAAKPKLKTGLWLLRGALEP